MEKEEIEKVIIDYMHQETGFGPKLRDHCEFEELHINDLTTQKDGIVIIEFRYDFDADGFSQYDKTILFSGRVKIFPDKTIEEIHLYIIHQGVASHGPRSKRKFEFREDLF
ncbi:hypothetical protein KAU33_01265 [Candidatus Dependentiae bacterium]|nr:hypothetical protein [Candidatus Dependentiae bacterium]